MVKNTKDLLWTPKRRGKIYCSPACGGRCTYAAYLKARKDAAKLAYHLGPNWKPRVWENLGWHWQVTCGALMLSKHDRGAKSKPVYYAMLAPSSSLGGGLTAWTDKQTFTDPFEAVRHCVANARKYVSGLNTPVQQAEKDCGLLKDPIDMTHV